MSTTSITIPTSHSLHQRLRQYLPADFINYFANRFAGWDRLSVRGFVTDVVIVTILIPLGNKSNAEQIRGLKQIGTLLINSIVDDPNLKSQSIRFLEKWISEC